EERIRCDYILYINKVSRLPAVTENRNRLVSDCSLNKNRNCRSVITSRALVGTKDVKITKANSGKSPFIGEGAAVSFTFILACGIRTLRLGRHALHFWHDWVVAVNCSRAAEDQLFHPGQCCLFQNNRCTPSIDLSAFIRILHGFLHAHHSREMKDKVHTFHGFSDKIAIENRANDELASQTRQVALKT